MIELRLLRENPDLIRETLKRRGSQADLDGLLALEEDRRRLIASIEQRRQAHKQASDEFARQKGGRTIAPPAKLKTLSDEIQRDEQRLKPLEERLERELAFVPNIPHRSVPVGYA